jgi:adenine-specific DNA-methyltransferase
MLYPRDRPSIRNWFGKGKDEQDRQDLAVPVVPIYIQEKIHPQAIIDCACPARNRATMLSPTFLLISTVARRSFEQKVDFYHHEQNWTNRLILGDSLLGDDFARRKGRPEGQGPDRFLDPPYGIKFWFQLAGEHPQA